MNDGIERPTRPERRGDDPRQTAESPPVDDGVSGTASVTKADPGGPYFGRLLIVLFAAVAFCAAMTWYLSTSVAP